MKFLSSARLNKLRTRAKLVYYRTEPRAARELHGESFATLSEITVNTRHFTTYTPFGCLESPGYSSSFEVFELSSFKISIARARIQAKLIELGSSNIRGV